MHDALVIYKQVSLQFDENGNLKPFEGVPVHTLSYDEKPGMQALNTTAEDRPPIPDTDKNSTIYRGYEYVRLGTLSLLAAIDLLTGLSRYRYKHCKHSVLISKTHLWEDPQAPILEYKYEKNGYRL